jgi:hypothetical protein
MQFADIKNDIAFRKIFGNETKTEILISFLNAVLKLEGNKQITWVEILNPYQLARIAGKRQGRQFVYRRNAGYGQKRA